LLGRRACGRRSSMSFDLEQLVDLALFARVVESRSFSEAARISGIAKSAVSRRIALLEQRVGVQLLRRTTRKLHVTPEGTRFYEHCARIVASARAAQDAVAGAETTLRGRVRISAPVTFAQMHLARALARFLIDNPTSSTADSISSSESHASRTRRSSRNAWRPIVSSSSGRRTTWSGRGGRRRRRISFTTTVCTTSSCPRPRNGGFGEPTASPSSP
jgi:Bacterial regulatory helix-turn-helix protein, lysR family